MSRQELTEWLEIIFFLLVIRVCLDKSLQLFWPGVPEVVCHCCPLRAERKWLARGTQLVFCLSLSSLLPLPLHQTDSMGNIIYEFNRCGLLPAEQSCSMAVPWGRQSTSLAPSFKGCFFPSLLAWSHMKSCSKVDAFLSWEAFWSGAERTCRCPSPCHYSPRILPFWPILSLKIAVAWGKPSVFSLILDSISLILGNAPPSHSLPSLYGFHGRYSLPRWSWRKMPIKFLVRLECLQKTFT